MALVKEFKAFLSKGNVLDLAVAVVIGAAFGKIVTAIVEGLIMPLLGFLLPAKDWTAWTVTSVHFRLGLVLGAIVDFVAVAAVVFLVFVKGVGALRKEPEAVKNTRTCPECLEEIPIAARRCRACTSAQPVTA
jgi:large conductance mechanosensitive channel